MNQYNNPAAPINTITNQQKNPFLAIGSKDQSVLQAIPPKSDIKVYKPNRKKKNEDLTKVKNSFSICDQDNFSFLTDSLDFTKQLSYLEVLSVYLGFNVEVIEKSTFHSRLRFTFQNPSEKSSVIFELKCEFSNTEVLEYCPIEIKLSSLEEDLKNVHEKMLINWESINNLIRYLYIKVYSN